MKDYFPGNLGGNDRRFSRNNRSYDNTTLTRNLDPRNGNYRNNGYQRKKNNQDAVVEALSENLVIIKDQLQTISDVQKRMADAQERRADAEERHATAMERIAEYLMTFIGAQPPATASVEDTTSSERLETQEAPKDLPPVAKSKSAVEIITGMRQDGHSYDSIAEQLIAQGVPTASGKGSWNRKMVSRLYQDSTH
jgi:hypothetical protein